MKDKKILIVSPHPDDEAICCGGLIMKAKKEGAEVFVLYVSTGTSRQFQNGKTYEAQRADEARRASKYGGFKYDIGFMDTSTKVDMMPQKTLIEYIENMTDEFKPDIVVIPNLGSYSQDHRAVATASISAFRPIPHNFHHQPTMILEMEEPCSWPNAFNPNFYVDITDSFVEKIELYQCHKSQVTEEPQYRSPENLERLAGFRGSEIGVTYAEAYKLLKGQL